MTVIKELINGNQRFRQRKFLDSEALYKELDETGQSPSAVIVSCSDSRVSPEIIFDVPPGSLFVVRNIAGFVPPYNSDKHTRSTTAAIEYAIGILNVPAAIVLPHSHSAGIAYGTKPKPKDFRENHPNLAKWLDEMNLPVSPETYTDIEQFAAYQSLKNLATYPCVIEALTDQGIELAAMHFNIGSGMATTVG